MAMFSFWYTLLAAFLFDSRLTLTDSFATDIAFEGTALASGPFRDQEAVNHGSVDQLVKGTSVET